MNRIVTTIALTTLFALTAYAANEPEMDIHSCKETITTAGRLLHVKKICGVNFDESETLKICVYCTDTYKISDEELFDLGALGRISFNKDARENGKFRTCKDEIEKYPHLFSY